MPGILGIVYLPDDPPGARVVMLRRMCERIRGPHDRLEIYESAECALAVARLDTDTGPERISVGPDRVIAGEGSRMALASVPDPRSCAPPMPVPSTLAVWDIRDRALSLVSDRYGFLPVCHADPEGRFAFASSALAILAGAGGPTRLDDRAASDLVVFGHLLGDRTLVEGVELVPPATVLTWQRGRMTSKRYWTPEYRENQGGPQGAIAVTRMAECLEAAVQRCAADGVGALLSGGLDSRTVTAEASRRHRVIGLTFGEPDSDDVRLSARVARSLAIDHHLLEITPEDLPHHAETLVRRTDGSLNLHHAFAVGAFDAIRDHCAVALSGMQMLGSFVASRLRPASAGGSVLPLYLPPLPREFRMALLTEAFFEATEWTLCESLAAVESSCPFRSPINRLDALDIAHRQRRFIRMGHLPLCDRVEVRLPLFDEDLMDFIRGVAPSLRADQRLYVAAFRRLFPDLSRIPWTRTGLPVSAGPARLLLGRLLRRLPGRRPRPSLAMTSSWHRRSPALCDFERDLLLGPAARERGIYRPDAIEFLLTEQEKGSADHWDLLGRIATLELWCRIMANP